jgi:hypothetical protein
MLAEIDRIEKLKAMHIEKLQVTTCMFNPTLSHECTASGMP